MYSARHAVPSKESRSRILDLSPLFLHLVALITTYAVSIVFLGSLGFCVLLQLEHKLTEDRDGA